MSETMRRPRLLFLDDDSMRHEWADEFYSLYDVHHAYNIAQFRKALERHHFEVVSFDHDIDGPPHAPSVRFTGVTCAEWMIQQHPDRHPDECIVHSWNPSGGDRIEATLRRAGFTVTRRMAGTEGL
jgi:hypothetical protein